MSRKLSMNLSLEGIELGPKASEVNPKQVIAGTCQNIMSAYSGAQRGLNKPERALFYGIAEALQAAVKDNSDAVELTDEQGGFLKKCLLQAKMDPSEVLKRVETLIDAMEGYR